MFGVDSHQFFFFKKTSVLNRLFCMMKPDISNGGFWGSGADFTFLTFLAFPDFPGKLGKVESKLIKVAVPTPKLPSPYPQFRRNLHKLRAPIHDINLFHKHGHLPCPPDFACSAAACRRVGARVVSSGSSRSSENFRPGLIGVLSSAILCLPLSGGRPAWPW